MNLDADVTELLRDAIQRLPDEERRDHLRGEGPHAGRRHRREGHAHGNHPQQQAHDRARPPRLRRGPRERAAQLTDVPYSSPYAGLKSVSTLSSRARRARGHRTGPEASARFRPSLQRDGPPLSAFCGTAAQNWSLSAARLRHRAGLWPRQPGSTPSERHPRVPRTGCSESSLVPFADQRRRVWPCITREATRSHRRAGPPGT